MAGASELDDLFGDPTPHKGVTVPSDLNKTKEMLGYAQVY